MEKIRSACEEDRSRRLSSVDHSEGSLSSSCSFSLILFSSSLNLSCTEILTLLYVTVSSLFTILLKHLMLKRIER